jgi:hypothetical protein
MKPATMVGAALIFLLLFFVQGLFFIRANSPTYDEAMHIAAGYSYLVKRDFRIEPQNPPFVKQLLALPLFVGYRTAFNPNPQHWNNGDGYLIGQDLVYKSIVPADRILLVSRLPNLLIGGILVALTGWWAFRLWGTGAAVLAMALASLEPNLIAHSSLVTTDIGVTLLIFLSIYLLWEYRKHSTWRALIAVGIFTGMALVAKFSAVLLLPIIALVSLLSYLLGADALLLPSPQARKQSSHPLIESAALVLLICFVAALIIPTVYFFQGFRLWLSGLQRFLTLAQEGQPAFFLGEYSYEGRWNYFIIAFLIKTPLGSFALIIASLILFRIGRPFERSDSLFLLLPPILIFAAMTQSKTNIGLRHILPVYPFLFVLASRVTTIQFRRQWLAPFLIGTLIVLTAISSLRSAPHQLAYFNEFVGGPDQGYRYLSDSNVDWGQDLKGLKDYIDKENLPIIYLSYFGTAPPYYYGIRYQYVPGTWPLEWPPPAEKVPATASRKILAISVCNLQDILNPYDPLFRWLWMRQPVAKIGYSIFVYDLTRDREGLMKLEETYVKAGIVFPS